MSLMIWENRTESVRSAEHPRSMERPLMDVHGLPFFAKSVDGVLVMVAVKRRTQ